MQTVMTAMLFGIGMTVGQRLTNAVVDWLIGRFQK
jgi:hypothetical protein